MRYVPALLSFCLMLLTAALLLVPGPARAGAGTDILNQMATNPSVGPDKVVDTLVASGNISQADATSLVQNILDNPTADLSAQGKVLDGIIDGSLNKTTAQGLLNTTGLGKISDVNTLVSALSNSLVQQGLLGSTPLGGASSVTSQFQKAIQILSSSSLSSSLAAGGTTSQQLAAGIAQQAPAVSNGLGGTAATQAAATQAGAQSQTAGTTTPTSSTPSPAQGAQAASGLQGGASMCPDGTGPSQIGKPYEPTTQGSYCDVRGGGARPHKGVDMMQKEGYEAPIPQGCKIMMNGSSPIWCQGKPNGVGGYGYYMRFACGKRSFNGKEYKVEVRYAHIKAYNASNQKAIVSCSGCVGITPHVHYEVLVEGRKVNPVCVWGEGISNNVSCPSGLSKPANLCEGQQLQILFEQACHCPGFGCGGPGATTSMNYHDGVDPSTLSGQHNPNSGCSNDDSGGTPNNHGSPAGSGGGGEGPESGQGQGDPNPAYKEDDQGCYSCCCPCTTPIINHHKRIRNHVDEFDKKDEQSEFEEHRNWMVKTFLQGHILPAMDMMTSQLTTVGIEQVRLIGSMLDAKHQLETQRLFQTLAARAHKDYHPSEGLCEFGTVSRSLLASERRADVAHMALAQHSLKRQLGGGDVLSVEGDYTDKRSRLDMFVKTFCDVSDNGMGLKQLCRQSVMAERRNRDVDYTRTVETEMTLNLDFTNIPSSPAAGAASASGQQGATAASPDEEDILALSSNLFAHIVLPHREPNALANDKQEIHVDTVTQYMDLRAVVAKRSVAVNSFSAIAAQRASGDPESAPFVKRVIAELGVPEADIDELIGRNPSYFAQMEILTKKIYENPTFYTELYDKPANIDRKAVALKAIGLMQDRDIYQSLLRSEMIGSVILETILMQEQESMRDAVKADPGTGKKAQ